MLKKALLLISFLTGVLFFPQASAADFVAGTHYEVLPEPVPTRDRQKIEVVELFWYGCTHCFHFEPLIKTWKSKQPTDVDYHAVPAMWNKKMALHAQAFYTAQSLGILEKIHEPFFNRLNVQKKSLNDENELADFFAGFGVDREKFRKTFNSFGVTSQVNLADSRARSYRIQGTPEMIVNGKYRVSSSQTGSQARMLEVVDFLVAKERAALVAPAKK